MHYAPLGFVPGAQILTSGKVEAMTEMGETEQADVALNRSINLPMIVFYGVGTMLGAGIYVLVSKVAASAGMYVPLAFLVSAIIVSFSALSYSELSSRLPVSAGEAAYVQAAFSRKSVSATVGFAVVLTGIVSAATISRGFVGYLDEFFEIWDGLAITSLVLIIGLIAAWGVNEAVGATVAITLLEISGVLLVIIVGAEDLLTIPDRLPDLVPPADPAIWTTILFGSFLAFYAFIGFEDMVNMAEEIKNPEKTLPKAIILALVVTTTMYILVSLVAVLSLPTDALIESEAPFTDIVRHHGLVPPWVMSAISLVAVLNGALVQVIMASRVLYGMAHQGTAPKMVGKVHPRTKTPLLATGVVTLVVLILALGFPLEGLARLTSFIVLCVFTMVNLSLVVIKARQQDKASSGVRYPIVIPILGAILSCAFLLVECFRQAGGGGGH